MVPFSSPTEQANAIHRAASRARGKVVAIGVRDTSVGPYVAARLSFGDPWGAARFLVAISAEDAETPGARDLALSLGAGRPGFVEAAFRYVQRSVVFAREAGEVFQQGSYTLAIGAGDCDDQARLLYAVLVAGGARARLVFLTRPGATGPVHVVTQACVAGAWQWLETTIAARMGEAPYAAAERLGLLRDRADIARDAVILDERTLEPTYVRKALTVAGVVAMGALATAPSRANTSDLSSALATAPSHANTSDLSSGFFRGVEAMAARARGKGADVDGSDFLAVWNGESAIRAKASGRNADGSYDYGLNQLHDVPGLRAVGWTGTPEAYLALTAEQQLPYVEAYYNRVIGSAWPRISGGRGLYVANGWPGALSRGLDTRDDGAILATKNDAGYYTSFDPAGSGVNTPAQVDAWIARWQAVNRTRWNEAIARLEVEGGAPAPGPHWGLIGAIALASAAVAYAAHRHAR
jgi:transglutaminase-like putative cysteine protease